MKVDVGVRYIVAVGVWLGASGVRVSVLNASGVRVSVLNASVGMFVDAVCKGWISALAGIPEQPANTVANVIRKITGNPSSKNLRFVWTMRTFQMILITTSISPAAFLARDSGAIIARNERKVHVWN